MKLQAIQLKNTLIEGSFWSTRVRLAREVIIPYQWEVMNDRVPGVAKSGAVRNFKIAAGKKKGDFYGHVFQDSDLGKWLEAAVYSLSTHPDEKLEKTADYMIDLIDKAQDKNGYLNTYFAIKDKDKRWTNLRDWHELYCAGHLIEAAVAYYEATGKRKFLNVMCQCADHIGTIFGPRRNQNRGYPGHPEIELALIKLYRVTAEKRYLNLAKFFVDERGRQPHYFDIEAKARGEKPKVSNNGAYDYTQAHLSVRRQTTAEGHSVRACYLYSAMIDVAAETGDKDLLNSCRRIWRNITERRMYIHGGVGSSRFGERFTFDYDLPNEEAYAETCATIALIFFAHRMLQVDPDGCYSDVMERALYNGVLSGVSLDGKHFFYDNYLASYPGSHRFSGQKSPIRQGWFGCACCPTNLARLLTSLGKYCYSLGRNAIYVHLYVGGTATFNFGGHTVILEQKTEYPWKDKISMRVVSETPTAFVLSLRIPGWCRRPKLKVNGKDEKVSLITKKGYAQIKRKWENGDRVELTLPMPIELVESHPRVRMNAGRVAIQCGPVLYCIEEADNGKDLNDIALVRNPRPMVSWNRLVLGGIPVITAKAIRGDYSLWKNDLYHSTRSRKRKTTIKAIPYSLWANRKEGEMLVWIRQA